jgi:hypothetical protein
MKIAKNGCVEGSYEYAKMGTSTASQILVLTYLNLNNFVHLKELWNNIYVKK